MVAQPPWMSLIAPDPLPPDQQPSQVREVAEALVAAVGQWVSESLARL